MHANQPGTSLRYDISNARFSVLATRQIRISGRPYKSRRQKTSIGGCSFEEVSSFLNILEVQACNRNVISVLQPREAPLSRYEISQIIFV